MCGRFAVTATPQALAETFELGDAVPVSPVYRVSPRYNISPGQPVLAVRVETSGADATLRVPAMMQWGLVPSWSHDPMMGRRMFNARAETVTEKPAFRTAWRRRRCLIPADAYYEWRREGTGRAAGQPFAFALQSGRTMGMAGLWETWEDADGSYLESCTILTVEANALTAPVHDRMPLILHPADYDVWLDPAMQDKHRLFDLAQPFPAGEMRAWPVSTWVNSPVHDDPQCLEPADEACAGAGHTPVQTLLFENEA